MDSYLQKASSFIAHGTCTKQASLLTPQSSVDIEAENAPEEGRVGGQDGGGLCYGVKLYRCFKHHHASLFSLEYTAKTYEEEIFFLSEGGVRGILLSLLKLSFHQEDGMERQKQQLDRK